MTYTDAYLGLGVYDYEAGHLGGVLKLSFLLGVHGDVKRGLERIQLATQKGRYGSRQAAQFLSTIYILDEHDYARALPIIQKLRQDFPESPYFQFLEVYLRHRLGDWDGSYREASSLFDRLKKDPPVLKRKLLSMACGLTGDKCLDPGLTGGTLPWFEHALEVSAKAKPDAWEIFLRLCRGQAADVAGERALAVRTTAGSWPSPMSSGSRPGLGTACRTLAAGSGPWTSCGSSPCANPCRRPAWPRRGPPAPRPRAAARTLRWTRAMRPSAAARNTGSRPASTRLSTSAVMNTVLPARDRPVTPSRSAPPLT